MKRAIHFNLNGEEVSVDVEETASLLDTLRSELGLTSPRYGCGAGECGTCAVIIDGEDRASCMVEAGHIEGKRITTVEGIGTAEAPHPIQVAFLEKQAGQCGYCLSGLIVGAKALLDRNPSPTRDDIAGALSWHLCRCGVHNRVIDAIQLAAQRLQGGAL
ncbi:MAG TPA: (2Fe-2S)-binding protein [Pseudomonadales bacterium]|nr:(2Fe-2S)-binding protein [Pseudomonadales bacterium]